MFLVVLLFLFSLLVSSSVSVPRFVPVPSPLTVPSSSVPSPYVPCYFSSFSSTYEYPTLVSYFADDTLFH
jgi:hypothetical protein